jgi:hypothetical protein
MITKANCCPNCNALVEEGFKFCGECGAEMTATKSRLDSPPNPSVSPNFEPTRLVNDRLAEPGSTNGRKRRIMFRWIFGVWLLLMGCAFLIGEWQRRDNGRYTLHSEANSTIIFDTRTGMMHVLANKEWVDINPMTGAVNKR